MALRNGRSNGKTRILIWTTAVLLVALVGWLAHLALRTVLQVRAYTVATGSILSTVSTNGKVQPVVNWEAHAPFPGLVQTVNVREGDAVPAGKLLLTMDGAEAQTRLAQARATLAGAEAGQKALAAGGQPEERVVFSGQLDQARAEAASAAQSLATLQKLAGEGAASPSEVAQAQNRLREAQASLQTLEQRQTTRQAPNLTQAQAEVTQARAAVAASEAALARSAVRAPFGGTVYSLSVASTAYVQQGDRLLQMADLHRMEVLAYFDEPDIGKLSVGQTVTIKWSAHPDDLWHGRITRLPSTVLLYTTRNVGEVYCSIDDMHGGLLPDTNVEVTVTTNNLPNALFVPREAQHIEQGVSYVYKVVNGKLRRTQVQVGSLNLTQVQILSGLRPGDVVALGTLGGQPLTDGAPAAVLP